MKMISSIQNIIFSKTSFNGFNLDWKINSLSTINDKLPNWDVEQ